MLEFSYISYLILIFVLFAHVMLFYPIFQHRLFGSCLCHFLVFHFMTTTTTTKTIIFLNRMLFICSLVVIVIKINIIVNRCRWWWCALCWKFYVTFIFIPLRRYAYTHATHRLLIYDYLLIYWFEWFAFAMRHVNVINPIKNNHKKKRITERHFFGVFLE